MKPNKPEVDALRAVLMTPLNEFITDKESETHKDPEGLAQSRMFSRALEAAYDELGRRTTWLVVLRHGKGSSTVYSGWGAWSTKAQAEKALAAHLVDFDHTAGAIVPVRGESALADLLAEIDAPPPEAKIGPKEGKQLDAKIRQYLDGEGEKSHIRGGWWTGRGGTEIKHLGNARDLHRRIERAFG